MPEHDTTHAAPRALPRYLDVGGEQVYVVLHASPIAPSAGAVLLAGALGSERAHAHHAWRRWAEHLAAAGFDVLRFDYRGLGESTGDLESVRFADWVEDARACRDWLAARAGGPLLVHGLRFGALVAAELHARGASDGLLAWDPPESGRALTSELLRARIAEDAALPASGPRASRAELVAALARGEGIEIGGHRISSRLWRDIEALAFPVAGARESDVHALRLASRVRDARRDEDAIAIPHPPFWRPSRVLAPDLRALFDASTALLRAMAGSPRERCARSS